MGRWNESLFVPSGSHDQVGRHAHLRSASDTEAAFLNLNLLFDNDTVSTKIYEKRHDFDFDIVNFLFLDGDVPRLPSYGVYISQLIRFARTSLYVSDFNSRNIFLTAKRLK